MHYEQTEGLRRAAAAKVHEGQIGPALDSVGDGCGGLFGGFTLALHASPPQPVHIGLELAALHHTVR